VKRKDFDGWTDFDNIKVTEIGKSNSKEEKIVCTSYNAG